MKKNLLSIFALISLISLGGCGNNEDSSIISSSITTTSETSSQSTPDNLVEYKTTVLLPNGEKAANCQVQWCAGGMCKTAKTDSNGVATIMLEANDYTVHVLNYPEQYTCELGFVATKDNRELTISLVNLSTPTSGEGSVNNPYLVSAGAYFVTIETAGDILYFGFNPEAVGNYKIESLYTSSLANPNVGYYGTDLSNLPASPLTSDDDSGEDINFKLDFAVEDASSTYVFGVSASDFKKAKSFSFIIKSVD